MVTIKCKVKWCWTVIQGEKGGRKRKTIDKDFKESIFILAPFFLVYFSSVAQQLWSVHIVLLMWVNWWPSVTSIESSVRRGTNSSSWFTSYRPSKSYFTRSFSEPQKSLFITIVNMMTFDWVNWKHSHVHSSSREGSVCESRSVTDIRNTGPF